MRLRAAVVLAGGGGTVARRAGGEAANNGCFGQTEWRLFRELRQKLIQVKPIRVIRMSASRMSVYPRTKSLLQFLFPPLIFQFVGSRPHVIPSNEFSILASYHLSSCHRRIFVGPAGAWAPSNTWYR